MDLGVCLTVEMALFLWCPGSKFHYVLPETDFDL